MAEQKLDVRVTEQGTAVVVSQLEKLTAQLDGVTEAQKKELAAAERSAAATEKGTAALEGWLKKQESKFAVVDRVAGLLGKVNLAIDLVTKAYEFSKKYIEDYIMMMRALEPALAGVNKELDQQAKNLDRIAKARLTVLEAGGTIEEGARGAGLQVAMDQAKTRIAELQQEADTARANDAEGIERANARPLARINEELERVQFNAIGAKLEYDKLIADINARESGTGKPPGGKGKGKVEALFTGTGDTENEQANNAGLIAAQNQGIAETSTLAAQQIDTQAEALAALAAAYANAATMAEDFASATGRAALSAAVAAVFAGKSIAEGVSIALEAKAQEATVESLWWLVKAGVFAFTAPQLVGPALTAAAGFGAVAAAAGLGSALLGGGGGGGGGSSGGGSGAPSNADFGPRRERDDGGGTTIVNVYNDGLTLSTEQDIGRAVAGSLQAVARSPGSREGAIQINTGGSRRR